MSAASPVPRPTWTRRVPGWSFLLFFVSLAFLTYLAVYLWNQGDLVSTGYVAGLASVVPIALVAAVYYGRPLWGLGVPLETAEVRKALATVAGSKTVRPVPERKGPFGKCASVVRLDNPPCTLGYGPFPGPVQPKIVRERTLVLLRPESRDRKAQAAFRASLASALSGSAG